MLGASVSISSLLIFIFCIRAGAAIWRFEGRKFASFYFYLFIEITHKTRIAWRSWFVESSGYRLIPIDSLYLNLVMQLLNIYQFPKANCYWEYLCMQSTAYPQTSGHAFSHISSRLANL